MMRPRLLIGALAILLAGCGHGHTHKDAAAGKVLKDEDDAADAIVASVRAYVEARERGGAPIHPKVSIAAADSALETLKAAADALRVAHQSEHLADDPDMDAGRAARVKSAAALVRRAAQVAANQARETLRSGDDAPLEADRVALRAVLRACSVDLYALERED